MFLTAKTTAMVCWLFVGSALFSAVFAILGGQALLESWVLSLNMTPVQFMILSQAIIFVLGWPLEWTEIIIIFVPIFLPMLKHFGIDPILWGMLVFVNLQAAFLSPPVAMSAFYLKGVAPKHVTLNQIFAGMMPYMLIVIVCMVIMYLWPGMTLWLPNYLYGELERFPANSDRFASRKRVKTKILSSVPIPSERSSSRPDEFLLPVACQHLLAALADLGAVLLQAGQHDLVAILHLRPAIPRDVARAGSSWPCFCCWADALRPSGPGE